MIRRNKPLGAHTDHDFDNVGDDEIADDPFPESDLAFSKIGSRKTW
jgi:hypothetical protein